MSVRRERDYVNKYYDTNLAGEWAEVIILSHRLRWTPGSIHGVLEEHTWSPGVCAPITSQSPWSLCGVYLESTWSPQIGILGLQMDSTWNLGRLWVDSRWTLWLRTFSKSETKCNMRSRTPDHTIYDYIITFFRHLIVVWKLPYKVLDIRRVFLTNIGYYPKWMIW